MADATATATPGDDDGGDFVVGSRAPAGWSNRAGTVLTPAAVPGVHTADRPFVWNDVDVGGRMTVVELPSSSKNGAPDLFVHSPVLPDPPLVRAVNALGTVRHVVSPNYEHVKYARAWAEIWPEASTWACPGLAAKEPDVRWTNELPTGCRPTSTPPEGSWDWDALAPIHVDCERMPILNAPFFSEVLFYHAPSKTLLTTDFWWNYPSRNGVTNDQLRHLVDDLDHDDLDVNGPWELAPEVGTIPLGTTLWKFAMDKIYLPVYLNLLVNKRGKDFRDLAHYLCEELDVETIVPCHGDIVRGKSLVRKLLRKHLGLDD